MSKMQVDKLKLQVAKSIVDYLDDSGKQFWLYEGLTERQRWSCLKCRDSNKDLLAEIELVGFFTPASLLLRIIRDGISDIRCYKCRRHIDEFLK